MIDIETSRKKAQEALERSEKATEGPWKSVGKRNLRYDKGRQEAVHAVVMWRDGMNAEPVWVRWDKGGAVSNFIAEARTDVPQLANDLLKALEEIERLTETLDDYRHAAIERGERD